MLPRKPALRRRWAMTMAVVACILGSAYRVRAQGDEEERLQAVNDELMQADRTYAAGDMSAARKHAEAAYRIIQAPKTLGFLALTYAQQGRDVEAADLARRYLATHGAKETALLR